MHQRVTADYPILAFTLQAGMKSLPQAGSDARRRARSVFPNRRAPRDYRLLINSAAVGVGGWQIGRPRAAGERNDDHGHVRKSLPQHDLEVLVQFRLPLPPTRPGQAARPSPAWESFRRRAGRKCGLFDGPGFRLERGGGLPGARVAGGGSAAVFGGRMLEPASLQFVDRRESFPVRQGNGRCAALPHFSQFTLRGRR